LPATQGQRWTSRSGSRRPPPLGRRRSLLRSSSTIEKRLGGVERIRLDQHPIEIQAGQQRLESGPLTGFVGVVGPLSQCYAKSPGVHGDLGHKTVVAAVGLNGRAAQRLANRFAEAQGLHIPTGRDHLPRLGSG
jgi:hypothetical protein